MTLGVIVVLEHWMFGRGILGGFASLFVTRIGFMAGFCFLTGGYFPSFSLSVKHDGGVCVCGL